MHRWVAVAAAALCFSASALAAPGWSVTGFTVMPNDAPKVIAAFDALFGSAVGQKLPGRVVLRANVADGPNPETHTVVVLSNSMAEREKFQAQLYADPAWANFLTAISAVNRAPGSTMQGAIIYNSGDRSDADVVWINHYLSVSEPAVLVSAMRTYSQTATGKAAPGQVHLSSVVAGGPGSATHIISIGYESQTEMADWTQKAQADPAYRTLVDTMLSVSDYHGATIQRDLKAWGKTSVKDVTAIGQ
jgi:hypothetical protein